MTTRLKPMLIAAVCILAISACNSKQQLVEVVAEAAKPVAQAAAVKPEPAATTESFLLETAVKQRDTFESLQKQYGDTHIIKSELPGAEGETSQGWIIYPNDPEKKLMLYLDKGNTHPGSLLVDEAKSKWHLSNSIKLGTDIKTLEKLNGKTFSFYGFDWDYGGVIIEWNGGELGKKTSDGSGFSIHLCPPEDSKLPDNYLVGDQTFKSDNPLAQKFPPVVCRLGVSIPDEKK